MRIGRSPNQQWRLGLYLGGGILALVLLIPGFGAAIINGYGRRQVERRFAATHPGCVLRIGTLAYAPGANRLVAGTITLESPGAAFKVDRVELDGVRWARWLLGRSAPAEAFAEASLEANGLGVAFTHAPYRVLTKRISASVGRSELAAEGIELRPTLPDEALFSKDAFRMTRYRVGIRECRVLGVAFAAWFQAGAFRARELQLLSPAFDALADRDKPVRPGEPAPLMVNEALAAIRAPLQVDRLSVTDGLITYAERVIAGAAPGVLSFTALDLRADDIANRGAAAIRLQAQCRLMGTGELQVSMTIPHTGADLALRYSGTLGAMDLTRLDAFLDRAEHTRIKSGSVDQVAFQVEIASGQARGRVRGSYRNLKMAVLNPATGTEKGLRNRMATFLMNTFRLQHGNPDAKGAVKEGVVHYRRKPADTFMQMLWFSLRSGVLDLIK